MTHIQSVNEKIFFSSSRSSPIIVNVTLVQPGVAALTLQKVFGYNPL